MTNPGVILVDDIENEYKCTRKTCGRISLRTSCILIATLYSLHSVCYILLILACISLQGASIGGITNRLSLIWNTNMLFFEAYFMIFALVLLCLGVHKLDYRRILVTKWVIIIFSLFNIVSHVRVVYLGAWIITVFHITAFILPILISIFWLHSYEFELWQLQRVSKGVPLLLKNPPIIV